VLSVCFVSETAQVELNSGQVCAPASRLISAILAEARFAFTAEHGRPDIARHIRNLNLKPTFFSPRHRMPLDAMIECLNARE